MDTLHTVVLGTLEESAAALGVAVQDLETFRPYDSSLPVPDLKGYRTVKCQYKINAKTGKALAENSYIRIADHINEDEVIFRIAELAPYVVDYLQGEEDKMIKAYHIAGTLHIRKSDLSIDSVIEAIEASGVSQRLNKEKIEEWFSSEMSESLTILFTDKLGISEEPTQNELDKLEVAIGSYKTKFVGLASGKTHYKEPDIHSMQKVLEITGADDTFIGGRFSARLEKMLKPDTDILLMSL